jgi:hypothetical protein
VLVALSVVEQRLDAVRLVLSGVPLVEVARRVGVASVDVTVESLIYPLVDALVLHSIPGSGGSSFPQFADSLHHRAQCAVPKLVPHRLR